MVLPALRNGKNLPFLYLHAQFSGHVARIWAFCRRKPPFLLQKHRILANSSRVGSAPATGIPNSCHRAPLRRVHIQKGLFLATERYSVLNYAARFTLSNRCRVCARRYEVGLRVLSLVPFNASCSASFAYQNITTFGVYPVQVAHPLWGYAACRRICSLAGNKTETWLTSSNV